MPCKKIIHTVGPRYNERYVTAAESALHYCYRNAMEMAVENKLTSLAVSCVYTERKGYPRREAAHIAIRTVRRFLEQFSSNRRGDRASENGLAHVVEDQDTSAQGHVEIRQLSVINGGMLEGELPRLRPAGGVIPGVSNPATAKDRRRIDLAGPVDRAMLRCDLPQQFKGVSSGTIPNPTILHHLQRRPPGENFHRGLDSDEAVATDASSLFHRLEEKRGRGAFIRPNQSTIGKHRRQLVGKDAAGDLDGTWCHGVFNSNTRRNNGVLPESPMPCKSAKYPTIMA